MTENKITFNFLYGYFIGAILIFIFCMLIYNLINLVIKPNNQDPIISILMVIGYVISIFFVEALFLYYVINPLKKRELCFSDDKLKIKQLRNWIQKDIFEIEWKKLERIDLNIIPSFYPNLIFNFILPEYTIRKELLIVSNKKRKIIKFFLKYSKDNNIIFNYIE